jgi:hypothetical protein
MANRPISLTEVIALLDDHVTASAGLSDQLGDVIDVLENLQVADPSNPLIDDALSTIRHVRERLM